jgi:DNA-binding transcriptional regulator YiaG
MKTKKIPSIAGQIAVGGASLDKWTSGETRLRSTFATKDGGRVTARLTRGEMDARIKAHEEAKKANAQVMKEIRAELELSQPKFARLLHTGPAAVKQWESARRTIPGSVLALAEIARDFPAVRERLEATAVHGIESAIRSAAGVVGGRIHATRKRTHA